ncbi:MAG: hypothetical protein WAT23_15155 [Chromatiaceae bacterium]
MAPPRPPAPHPLERTDTATRPARALLGWMSQEEAELALTRRGVDAVTPQHRERIAQVRAAVAARPAGIDQAEILSALPDALRPHAERLQALAIFAPLAAAGWSFQVADLAKVCALQPFVFWDQAGDPTRIPSAADLTALANLTLPIPGKSELPLHFDAARNTWIVTSDDQNLQILGHFTGPVQQHVGCGFLIGILPSFVQVARYRGRYLLCDGYHRCLGLLARGIRKVPVLFKDFAPGEALGIGAEPDILPEVVFLGERPPRLPDYLEGRVAAEVRWPATRKMLLIQGLEISPPG